ncbi:xylose isomerase-like protein [Fusarium avenaceum]|nr:xylose isomerase-like protein [Fusarium avenaceum]
MVLQYEGTEIPISFASCSIPMKIKASLPEKLRAMQKSGFDGIELSMSDIISYSELINGSQPMEDDYDTIADVAKQIKALTDELGLKIMMLQPFANFEGWKKGEHDKERKQAFDKARGWIKVMEAAGITLLQVGSSDSEGIASSFDDLAADLAELADMLAEKGFSIAYENWCWATHAPTWKTVWEIVQKANRPNIGLCLDTFQTAGLEWADPMKADGLAEATSHEERETRWKKSLEDLATTIPGDKIYLLQISDGYKMDPPIEDKKDESGSRPRCRWSHDYRPLPYDGGYLPVKDMLHAVLKTGFRSWLSVEVFDGTKEEDTDMNAYTQEAVESLKKLLTTNE